MIKKSLEFLIQSHLFLSFSAFVFSQGILKNQPISLYFSLALAFAVFGIYNLNRINKLKKNLKKIQNSDVFTIRRIVGRERKLKNLDK